MVWAGCAAGTSSRSLTTHPTPASRASVVTPTDAEAQLLQRLDDVPPGLMRDRSGQAFEAGAPYLAASGRTCRMLRPTSAELTTRLACRDGKAWFLVPVPFEAAAGEPSNNAAARMSAPPSVSPIQANSKPAAPQGDVGGKP